MTLKARQLKRGFRLAERFFTRRASLFSIDTRTLRGEKRPSSVLSRSFLREDLLPGSRD